jgi:plasmid stability protein
MAWPLHIQVFWSSEYNAIIAITWGYRMTSITVRNLDESIKAGLRLRAARHGWSMEQEVRQILRQTVAPEQLSAISFAEQINQRFAGLQAEALTLPARVPVRTPPTLE